MNKPGPYTYQLIESRFDGSELLLRNASTEEAAIRQAQRLVRNIDGPRRVTVWRGIDFVCLVRAVTVGNDRAAFVTRTAPADA